METTISPNRTSTSNFCEVGQFDFVMNAVVMGSISVFGLGANVLSVVVLERDRPKLPTTVLLQGLAVADSLFLVYTLLYSSLRTAILFHDVTETTLYISRCIFAYALPWGWTAQTASIWIVTMVTVDRYVAICHPYLARQHVSVTLTRRLLVMLCAAALVFNLPRFVYYHLLAFWLEPSGVKCGIFLGHLDVSSNKLVSFRTVYHIGLTFVFLFAIPLPIITCLNVRLVREVWRVRERIASAQTPTKASNRSRGQANTQPTGKHETPDQTGEDKDPQIPSDTDSASRSPDSKDRGPQTDVVCDGASGEIRGKDKGPQTDVGCDGASGEARGSTGSRERGVRTTVSLTAVVTVFVVCETPDLLASVLTLDPVRVHLHPAALNCFMVVKELLLVCNSATNFLIYCVFYTRFRRLLWNVCCGPRNK